MAKPSATTSNPGPSLRAQEHDRPELEDHAAVDHRPRQISSRRSTSSSSKLYEYETPQGGWPYPFDKKAKPADFVSYNAVLALAQAGRRPETDEHMASR